MVQVMNRNGYPLMPTERHGKVRRLLRDGKAKVRNHDPFTIQLLYDVPGIMNPATAGNGGGYHENA